MNKLFIGLIMVVVVGFIAGIAIKNPTSVDAAITTDKTEHDFGDIDIFAGKVETEYTLTNTGTKDVHITAAETSCMCTEGSIDGFTFGMHGSSGKSITIKAGESKTLAAIYDPLAHGPGGTGRIKRELIIKTNSTKTPELKVTLSANVVKNEF